MAPFTLGHALLLERLGSPFIGGPARLPGLGDLRLALALCSLTYPRAVKLVGRPRRLRLALWVVGWTARSRYLPAGTLQFFDYIRKFQNHPECWSGRGGGRAMGTPFFQAVKLTLVMHMGKTELEALCTPLSLALWDYAACWELSEKMELVSSADRAAMETLETLPDSLPEGPRSQTKPINRINGNGRS